VAVGGQKRTFVRVSHIVKLKDNKSLPETVILVNFWYDKDGNNTYDDTAPTPSQIDSDRIEITVISASVCDDSDDGEGAERGVDEETLWGDCLGHNLGLDPETLP
jgi:hypothetical protein